MNANKDTIQRERIARLHLEHSDENPDLIGTLPYVIHPPSKLSATAAWLRFHDKTLLMMMESSPTIRICRILSGRSKRS